MSDNKNKEMLLNQEINNMYSLKKASVVILFLKILYCVLVTILFGYGVYFVYMSRQEEIIKDKIEFDKVSGAWNTTYHDEFSDWRVYLINENGYKVKLDKDTKKMHDYDDKDEINYKPLQFISNNIKLFEKLKFNKNYLESTSNTYNLTTNLTLIIDDGINSKEINVTNIDVFIRNPNKMNHADCVKAKGLWSYEENRCYRYYVLRSLCLIINQEFNEERELYYNYKRFKCNGFYDWYETHSVIQWLVPSYDPNFDDITKNIKIYVSTNKDPYVWANYNGTLHYDKKTAESYSVAGVWLIISSITLIIIPLLIYFKDNNRDDEKEEEAKKGSSEEFGLDIVQAGERKPNEQKQIN